MIAKLLKKEFRLCLHPTTPLMLILSGLILVPNYPYTIAYFYLTLGFFFISMTGRENHDVTYSMTLPVAKKDIVTARFLFFMVLEAIDLLLVAVFVLLRKYLLLVGMPNGAGMDANWSLIALGFIYFGAFHLTFFPAYYKDVNKVGVSFIRSSVVLFLLVFVEIAATYALPFVRDRLDIPGGAFSADTAVFTAAAALFYAAATIIALHISRKRFAMQDIR